MVVVSRCAVNDGMAPLQHENLVVHRVRDPLAKIVQRGTFAAREISQSRWALHALSKARDTAKWLLFPDQFLPWALSVRRVISGLQDAPDVVVVSVGPLSAVIPARFASKRFRVPLVVDYRDLIELGTGRTSAKFNLRRFLLGGLERTLVDQAALICAVTEPMRRVLEVLLTKRAILVTNGFEPSDFANRNPRQHPSELRVVFSGTIYPHERNPTPLFRALSILQRERGISNISAEFFGNSSHEVKQSALKEGVDDKVIFHGEVSHSDSIQAQINADVLLLLYRENNPGEKDVYSGKLFEYIGANRPILCLGIEHGIGPDLIRANQLGMVLNTPAEIADYLWELVQVKKAQGRVPRPVGIAHTEFTRKFQSKLFLKELLELNPNK